ncbi:hypothetical protein L198_07644 [Cryptococcus wingfieldii CBS 7118]|uniref:Uncharacterized protein n=1 Tax=Cryptococcus wingfieldii CBS 7118 TaxID=1295528 RepID=A0A1E3I7X9_9TREE|nr:hypothetical protein L198_07644 [Cryptococcus wingfieldii CBS 7118]ODN83946.1 hypothetical protein L198_07644 [Cryptococcus wingfieldii CBS 7118]
MSTRWNWRGSRLGHNQAVRRVLRYDSDPSSPRDQRPWYGGVRARQQGKTRSSRSVHLYRRLLPPLSAQSQSAAAMVLRKSNTVDDLGGLEAIDLAYKSTLLLGYGDEGMLMLLRSWFRDMENEQVAASSDKPDNLGAAASNPLLVTSSGLIGAALGEEDMRFSSNEAELAHELPPVAGG